jgi:hypothetical protein
VDGNAAVRRVALPCVAGLALATVASWARFLVEGTLAIDTGSRAWIASAFVAGVGLAVAGACALRLARMAATVDVRALLGYAVLVHLAAAAALPLTSRDLYSNLAYGGLQRLGKSPYLAGPRALGAGPLMDLVAPRWLDTPSAYGPVVAFVNRAAASAGVALGAPLWGGVAVLKALLLLCALGTVWLAHRCARTEGTEAAMEGFALLAFSPVLAWEVSAQAHNDGVLVLALMCFVWAARRGHDLTAVLALAAGTLAKGAAAPVLLLYLVFHFRRSRRKAVALALAAAAVATVLVVPFWSGAATLRGPIATLGGDVLRHAHSLADLLFIALEPMSPRAAGRAYLLCWMGSGAVCLLLLVRGVRRALTVDAVLHEGLVLFLAYDLTAPWFQPWYAAWLLPLVVFERDAAFRRLVGLYAALTVALWIVPLDPVTTVAVNAWTAIAWYRLHRARNAPAIPVAA